MINDSDKIHRLTTPQMGAVEPSEHVWLSAAAGTGKTQVLSARVLRLLLQKDIKPEEILCITFTKAGAAEMANRINQRLASWVRMKNTRLALELDSIGADNSPKSLHRARQLFASLLDAPGGGLRVMTIHSFCQSLLSSFPGEASLSSGFRAMEEREQAILYRDALHVMCEDHENDPNFISGLDALSLAHGEDGARKFLQRCASAPDAMALWIEGQGGEILAKRLVGCTIDGDINDYLMNACRDENFDIGAVRACAALNMQWGTKRGIERAQIINDWLALDIKKRSQSFAALHGAWSKGNGQIVQAKSKGHTPPYDDYEELAIRLFDWSNEVQSQIQLHDLALRLNANFTVGKKFAQYYQSLKEQQALVDYDDLIRKSAALLNGANMADWIRYKLDQRIDHILIDEAQDTNQSQWDIIKALSDDFYSGEAAHDGKLRTIFTVGDFKQAIFGFQGTSPQNYSKARDDFMHKLEDANLSLTNLILSQSFRSTKPVLDFVNTVITHQGHQAFGLPEGIEDHFGEKSDVGSISLMAPVVARSGGDDNNDDDDEEKWLSEEKRVLADKLADQIALWIEEKPILSTTKQPLRPSDIMILLRNRGDLASLIVARLYAKKVPVAGIDRLFLSKPLAVQDLLSVVKFVLQPDDDLNLATLLTSPLIGLDHDALLKYGYRKQKISLWQHIRRQDDLAPIVSLLRAMLDIADYGSPYQFLEQILSGPLQGRKKIYGRLGFEAEVAINELLNTALQYGREQGQSLQGFLEWVIRGDVEIKRENSGDHDEVRVMTVHGSKGLQAPVVILADICVDPNRNPDKSFEIDLDGDIKLPMPSLDSASRIGRVKDAWEAKEAREREEHNRLLYVALTRSEERLILTGSIGKGTKDGVPSERSWYHPLENAMTKMNCEWQDDAIWGKLMHYHGSEAAIQDTDTDFTGQKDSEIQSDIGWLFENAPEESRPPKPLAPSRIIADDAPSIPLNDNIQKLAERGNLIHKLFEFLAYKNDQSLKQSAHEWFARQHVQDNWSAADIVDPVVTIMTDPIFAGLFGSNSRSEVPITAIAGEVVINGRIDHLVINDDEVIAIDFKTGSNIPEDTNSIARAYLRQMAHYASALNMIFPDKMVKTGLLYTNAPKLMMLDDEDIDMYKP